MGFNLFKRKPSNKHVTSQSNKSSPDPVTDEPAPRQSFTAASGTQAEDINKPNITSHISIPTSSQGSTTLTSTSISTSVPPSYAAHNRVTSQPRPCFPSESDYRAGFFWQKTPNLPTDAPGVGPHQYSAEEVAEMEKKGISPQLKWELDAYKRDGNGKRKKRGGFWTKVGMMDRIR